MTTRKLKVQKPAKRKATPEELKNDPTLRWNRYLTYEVLQADGHGPVRFLRYTPKGTKVVIGTIDGCHQIASVSPLSVRRPQ